MPRQSTALGGAAGRGRRLAGLAALAALAALIGGLPLLLRAAADVLLPSGWTPLADLPAALTSADDGSLLAQAVLAAGWVTWAVFCALVAWEIVRRLLGRPQTAGAKLRTPQGLAGVLVAAVVALAASTANSAHAAPAAIIATGDLHPDDDQPSSPARQQPGADPVLHLVKRGEALLDLQERYGVPWQRIAEANYDREQPDGQRLQRGHTVIHAGWQLRIPTATVGASAMKTATEPEPPTVCAGEHVLRIGDDRYAYVVQRDDSLWAIAELCLGDGARWPEIWDLNHSRHFPQVGGTLHDPDLIYPGWDLVLPPDATPPPEATPVDPPEAEPPAAPAEPQPTLPTDPTTPSPQPSDHPATSTPAPTPTSSATPSPAAPPEQPSHQADGQTALDNNQPDHDSGPSALVPIGFGAAVITATLAAAAAIKLRRRGPSGDPRVGRRGHRRGHRPHHVDNGTVEQRLQAAAHPLDVERLDTALRLLATGLASRPGRLPDIVGVHVADGDVRLLLAHADEQPPPPWRADGTQWILIGGEDLPPAPRETLAALPALVTVGSQAHHPGAAAGGEHLLLDLERLGCLSIVGDPGTARDLLRYLASELAMNTWADDVEVICAGWPPHEAELLTALNPDRVRAAGPIAEQVSQLRQRARIAGATLTDAGAADALTGRVHDLAGDSWVPTVLVACDPQPGDLDTIADLADDLARAGRCALAVATTGTIPTRGSQPDTAHTITTTPDRAVHVPFLDLTLAAAGLPRSELEPLARVITAARDGAEEPVPPAPEPEPWAVGTDAAGGLLPIDHEHADEAPDNSTDARLLDGPGWADTDQPPAPTIEPEPAASQPIAPAPPVAQAGTDEPPAAPAPPRPTAAVAAPPDRAQVDPTLDDDLAAWYQPVTDRPRIRVLGPVVEAARVVDAPGQPPRPGRLLLLAEVLVYLAQAGRRGASPAKIDADLWPGQEVQVTYRRATISRARQWAGKRADGTPWLAEVHYKLEDGYLLDWHLFRRLRARGQSRGPDGIADLRAALELVCGVPLAGYERIAATTRSPYNWLPTSEIDPDHLVAAIVDTASELAQLCLASGDTTGARWAVDQAWQADPDRNYDQPWQILLRIHVHDRHLAELEACVHELMRLREAEVEEDLDPATYTLLREVLPTSYWDRSREPAYQD